MTENLSSVSMEALIGELLQRRDQILTPNGLVIPLVYDFIVQFKPLPCVEVVPVRRMSDNQLGVIIRATGPEKGKLAVMGSGVNKNESISNAILRTLQTDLGINSFEFYGSITEETPFRVGQHLHSPKTSEDIPYDPTKHAVGVAYLVEINGDPSPRNEASDFFWITRDQIPPITAYNHWTILKSAFNYLET